MLTHHRRQATQHRAAGLSMTQLCPRFAVLLCLALFAHGVIAADIVVLGLFKDKAVVQIDGKRRTLTLGATSPEGVKLVSADSEGATLDVGGVRQHYTLGTHISSGFTGPVSVEVHIYATPNGMYQTNGSINGQPVGFLVDTGATLVSLNGEHAKRLGIDFRYAGKPGRVETASGVVNAYHVMLRSVRVGEIELREVEAVVLDGPFPSDVLLGMSFLGRLEMQRSASSLLLKKKG